MIKSWMICFFMFWVLIVNFSRDGPWQQAQPIYLWAIVLSNISFFLPWQIKPSRNMCSRCLWILFWTWFRSSRSLAAAAAVVGYWSGDQATAAWAVWLNSTHSNKQMLKSHLLPSSRITSSKPKAPVKRLLIAWLRVSDEEQRKQLGSSDLEQGGLLCFVIAFVQFKLLLSHKGN